MIMKLKELFLGKVFESKAEEVIYDINDTDKSIKTLKRLRILATPKVLNIIGVVLFIIMLVSLNIAISVFDMVITREFHFYNIIIPNLKYGILYVCLIIFYLLIYIKIRISIR